jgi:hypothetical protein
MLTKGINRNKGSHATEPTLKPHLSLIAHEVTTSQSSGLVRRSTSEGLTSAIVYQEAIGSDRPPKALGLVKRSTSESPFCIYLPEGTKGAPPLPSPPPILKTAYMTPFWSYLQNSTQGAKISQACDTSYFPKVRENKCFPLSPSRAGARARAVGTKPPPQARASAPLQKGTPHARALTLRVTPQVRASDPLPVCYLHHPEGLPRAFIPLTLALDRWV